MGAVNSFIRRVKEVFQIGIVNDIRMLYPVDTACLQFMNKYLPLWKAVYEGNPPWLEGVEERDRYPLGAAKVVCEYLAGYSTAELSITVDGEDSQANRLIQKTLEENAFALNLTAKAELCEAMGGLFVKPYNDGKKIVIDFVPAASFYPISWDNRRFTQGVFISEYTENDRVYTRLEAHLFGGEGDGGIVVENRLFVRGRGQAGTLGTELALSRLRQTENLVPVARFDREEPLFVHVFPNKANNLDMGLPVHISRFANALPTLRAIDEAYGEWQLDRKRSRKKIAAPAMWFRKRLDEEGNPVVRYDEDTDIYQMVDYHPQENQTPLVFAPSYEIEKWVRDIDAGLALLCLQTGLSTGSITFDAATGRTSAARKTAQEVRSEDSETFKTVAANQDILKRGIKELLRSILYLAQHPDFALLPPGDHEISVDFDDSITPDRETYITEGRGLVGDGLLSKYTFLTQYYQMTPQQADDELLRISREEGMPDGALNAEVAEADEQKRRK